ncbi:MAG: hypothetical protein ACR2JD_02690 [Nocardioides sp.]
MRLPSVPGPRDLVVLVERAGEGLEQLFAAVPRLSALLAQAERLMVDVAALMERIEETRAEAQVVVSRTDATQKRADALLAGIEPSLLKLQPTLERLAETTHPSEVDALVSLIDQLPLLAEQVAHDLMPVMRTLGTVSPDLHDLLDVSRELNGMLAKLPGIGRIKKRVDEKQGIEDATGP